MTTITLDIKFITIDVGQNGGANIHAATAVGYQYGSLCGDLYPHDTPEYRFGPDGNLSDVCAECAEEMEALGVATRGRIVKEFGNMVTEPNLLRAIQHLFEAVRHIEGYGKNCPVCGGTQIDGDEGCRMCLPLAQLMEDAKSINGVANAILLIEDPFGMDA